MIDLTAKVLPNTIEVDGRAFLINTDFRIWIRVFRDIKTGKDFDAGYVFQDERPKRISVNSLIDFLRPQNPLPRNIKNSNVIALDYDIDSDYIYAAFMEQYGIDLIDIPYLHWHKFIAMLNGLNEDTKLAKIMGYRCYEKSTKKKDPYEELRRAWEIEVIDPESEKEAEELLKAFEVN